MQQQNLINAKCIGHSIISVWNQMISRQSPTWPSQNCQIFCTFISKIYNDEEMLLTIDMWWNHVYMYWISFLRLPERDQNMPQNIPLSPTSTEFHKIPRKHRNLTRIIIGSDRRPETKQGIEGKIVRFRSGSVRDRVRLRIADLNQIADLKLSILAPVKFRSLIWTYLTPCIWQKLLQIPWLGSKFHVPQKTVILK